MVLINDISHAFSALSTEKHQTSAFATIFLDKKQEKIRPEKE